MTLPDSSRITRRRPLWVTAAAVLGVVVLVIAGLVVFVNLGSAGPTPTPTATGTAAPPMSPPPTGDAAGARGCLGGVDPNEAILQAHDEAELTPRGAAEFVGTFLRWTSQYPPDANYEEVARQVVNPNADPELLSKRATGGAQEDSAWATTTDARYNVSAFTDGGATVELVASGYVVSAGDEQRVESVGRWRLTESEGHWQILDVDTLPTSTVDAVRTDGHKFEGSC